MLLLKRFSTTLISDKILFEVDKGMLEKLSDESLETFYRTIASLASMEASAGAYKEAIKAAMDKIEEWQTQVTQPVFGNSTYSLVGRVIYQDCIFTFT